MASLVYQQWTLIEQILGPGTSLDRGISGPEPPSPEEPSQPPPFSHLRHISSWIFALVRGVKYPSQLLDTKGVKFSMAQEGQSVPVMNRINPWEGYIGPGDSVSRSFKT